MKPFRMLLEYEGGGYVGWQVQRQGESVQGLLQGGLERITGQTVTITGAGRTDAGVHALGQVASFRCVTRLPPQTLLRALNAHLPRDIRVLGLEEAPEDFHARYSATGKRYIYLIQNEQRPSVFASRWSWAVPWPLDLSAMEMALSKLVGRQDFSAFRGAGCGAKNPVRSVTSIRVERLSSGHLLGMTLPSANFIQITVEADGFLRHMVRNLVGFGVEVGRGRLHPSDAPRILALRDRRQNGGPTAPAQGLFLDRVLYPSPLFESVR